MFQELLSKKKKISVIGLGYVGLPIALEFAKHFSVIGYDIDVSRISMLRKGIDPSKELEASAFEKVDIVFTSDSEDLANAHFHIIAVPTDIDEHKVPDLRPLLSASETVGKIIKKDDYVVYESTVYPGCTEEDCIPKLVETIANRQVNVLSGVADSTHSTLQAGKDFKYGYSPERIAPGSKQNTLTKINKIVSGNDKKALEEISKVYAHIIEAEIYQAPNIKIAEAAKVIENTQRDINISLMNELAIIFDKMGIETREVIKAASSKWNFHEYTPGLVGGHCISVDPYYLIHKSRQVGHEPQVIAAGRSINDEMPRFIAKRMIQKLIEKGKNPGQSKVLVMGITYKENVADIRNSKVVELVKELKDYTVDVHVNDPLISNGDLEEDLNVNLIEDFDKNYDGILVAVGHHSFLDLDQVFFESISKEDVIFFDIKGIYKSNIAEDYWKL